MSKIHKVGAKKMSGKNLILLFFTIVAGFASVITLAQVNISSNISNAWQTIARITITSGGTEDGTMFFDFNSGGKTFMSTDTLTEKGSFSGNVLGIDENKNLIYVASKNLVVSGAGGTTTTTEDKDWTIVGNDIYAQQPGNVGIGTDKPTGKLHIINSGSTDVYIEEKAVGQAASMRLVTPLDTWIVGGDSSPDVFFIGVVKGLDQHQEYFTINPLGNVGIGTTTPGYKLDVRGGINATGAISIHSDTYGNVPDFEVYSSGIKVGEMGSNWIENAHDSMGMFGKDGVTLGTLGNWNSLFVSTGGNVGIGTTSPASKLHIAGLDPTVAMNIETLGSDSSAVINFIDGDIGPSFSMASRAADSEFSFKTIAAWPMIFGTNNIERMRIQANGNVGIGTDNPRNKLHVDGTGQFVGLKITSLLSAECLATDNVGNVIGTGCGTIPTYEGGADNLGNHTALQNLIMSGYRMAYDSSNVGLHILSDGRIQTFSTIQIANQSGLACNSTSSGTIKYIPNCFQGCDGSNWITLGGTCLGLPARCGDGIITSPEQCDDGNTESNDGCNADCTARETPPPCTFAMSPATGYLPLQVTFTGTETSRVVYTINFDNGSWVYNQPYFSGTISTYTTVGTYHPTLTAKNKYNLTATPTSCSTIGTGTIKVETQKYCGDGIVQALNDSGAIEQCDDSNTGSNDGCVLCKREMPTCNFTLLPLTTGEAPLKITFQGTEQSRAIYRINLGNGYAINNQRSFSGITYTYEGSGTYHPILTVKNKNNLGTGVSCSASGGGTITVTETPKYCGDGIIQSPNNSGDYEQCDLGILNSPTGKCGTGCTYNIPDCSIFSSQTIFTGGSGSSTLTGTISPRANYITKTTAPDGTEATSIHTEFKLQTGFNITEQYKTIGTYTITLLSNDGQGASCSTNINVYENGEYACGRSHNSDETSLMEGTQGLCAQGYKAINFTGHSSTISNVGVGKTNKHAVIIPESLFESYLSQFMYIDTGKNMVSFSGGYYIRYLRDFMSTNINILLPQQGYKYRTRDCADNNNDKIGVSSCYAHKKINGDCAYDMNIDSTLSSRYFTAGQIAEAMANSGYLFKCALVEDENSITEIPQYKFTRGLPTQGARGNAACQVIPVGSQTEQNLYYVHRVCPGYNYGQSSQSCDSILLSGQGIVSCAGLLAELYTSRGTGGFSTQH